jgi:hypothetical protein
MDSLPAAARHCRRSADILVRECAQVPENADARTSMSALGCIVFVFRSPGSRILLHYVKLKHGKPWGQ